MTNCRECNHEVSLQAVTCPNCGCPYPAKTEWTGWGYEYKSETRILGLPLLHISFKYSPDKKPVPAFGIIAIGQFAAGVVNISQFGIGIFSLGQFAIGYYALAQIGVAYSLIAQIGLYFDKGFGQFVRQISSIVM